VLLSDGRVVSGQVNDTNQYTKQRIEVDADDAVFVLSQMEKLNDNKLRSRFAGRLDPTRVGIFGHFSGRAGLLRLPAASTGGSRRVSTWMEDSGMDRFIAIWSMVIVTSRSPSCTC